MTDRLDTLRGLGMPGEAAISATIWCVLRYQAAHSAMRDGERAEAVSLLAAYARDELALWEAAARGDALCTLHDPALGEVTLRVGVRRFEEPLQVAHGAILSHDPALMRALGRWALDAASLRLTNIGLYTTAMIDALLAVWHRLPDAALHIEVARKLIPHNIDAARRWCGQLAQIARGELPTPPDRFYDRLWAERDSADYRAFWQFSEDAIPALRACSPTPDDDYPARRAARDHDPAAIAARLAPRDGFLWSEDVRRALEAGCYALAARFERDDLARAQGFDALKRMLSASLPRLDADERASAQAIIATAEEAMRVAMAPALVRRAQAAELARYQAQPAAQRDLRLGARLAIRQHSDDPEQALAWLATYHPDAPRAALVTALGAEAPGWATAWLVFIFDVLGEEAAHTHACHGHAASYHVAALATGERWPLLWPALELALREDSATCALRHGLGPGARTFAVASQLLTLRREGVVSRVRAMFEAQDEPLRQTLLTWLDRQSPPSPTPHVPTPTDSLIIRWELELEQVQVEAPAGTPAPLRRRRRRDGQA